LSDPNSDGWTVLIEVGSAYNKEKVPQPENSHAWFMRHTSTENIISFSAKMVWQGLQHATRSFLVHERDNQVLQTLLDLDQDGGKTFSPSHATAIAQWLALRASQRELIPMIIEAGKFLHMNGFDWVEDNLTPTQFVRTLPAMYRAWAR